MSTDSVVIRPYSPVPFSRRPPDEVTGAVNFDDWLETHEDCTVNQLVFLLFGYQPLYEPRDRHARQFSIYAAQVRQFSIYAAQVAQVLDGGMIDLQTQLDRGFKDGRLPGRMIDDVIVFDPRQVIPKIKPLARRLMVGSDVLDAFEAALRRKYPDYVIQPISPEDRYYWDAPVHDRGHSAKRDTDVPVNAPAPASPAAHAPQPHPEAEIAPVAETAWDEARVERLLAALWAKRKLHEQFRKPSTQADVQDLYRYAIHDYHRGGVPRPTKDDIAQDFKAGPGRCWPIDKDSLKRYLTLVWKDIRTAERWFKG